MVKSSELNLYNVVLQHGHNLIWNACRLVAGGKYPDGLEKGQCVADVNYRKGDRRKKKSSGLFLEYDAPAQSQFNG